MKPTLQHFVIFGLSLGVLFFCILSGPISLDGADFISNDNIPVLVMPVVDSAGMVEGRPRMAVDAVEVC